MSIKLTACKYTLESPSFQSEVVGGLLRKGDMRVLPAFLTPALCPFFKVESLSYRPHTRDTALKVGGGIGDKIYLIPFLYGYDYPDIGIEKRDEPLFRVVKTREAYDKDINISLGLCVDNNVGLPAQYAKILEKEPVFQLPILETLPHEKAISRPDRYIAVCITASDPSRNMLSADLLQEVSLRIGLPFVFIDKRLPEMLSIIEGAEAVLTVATSVIPAAIALQVPVVACDREKCAVHVKPSIEGYAVDPDVDEIVEVLERVLTKHRCWCGETGSIRFIKNNLLLLRCRKCGTVRQDIKVTPWAFESFFKNYNEGWRKAYVDLPEVETSKVEDDVLTWLSFLPENSRRWLDIGSGNGRLKELLHGAYEVKSVDPAGSADYESVTQAGQGYDVIVMRNSIHFLDLYRLMPEIIKRLKRGGRIIVQGYTSCDYKMSRFRYLFPLELSWVVKLFEQNGCKLVYLTEEKNFLLSIWRKL